MTIKGPSENLFHRGGVDIKWNGPYVLTCEMSTPQIIRICEVLIVVRRLLLGR